MDMCDKSILSFKANSIAKNTRKHRENDGGCGKLCTAQAENKQSILSKIRSNSTKQISNQETPQQLVSRMAVLAENKIENLDDNE